MIKEKKDAYKKWYDEVHWFASLKDKVKSWTAEELNDYLARPKPSGHAAKSYGRNIEIVKEELKRRNKQR